MGFVTSLFARKMVAAAGDLVDGPALLTSAGLDPEAPWDPKVMIAADAYYDLLEAIAMQTDATDLPVRGGASMRCDDYGALGLAWKAAPNLRGSFSRVERYARLWTSVVEYELRPDPRGTLFILHRAGARRLGVRLSNEATLASAVSLARQVCPMPFAPLEVLVQHPAPKTVAHHEAWFGCPVRFEADLDALLISTDALAQPNILGDEGISRYLISHLDAEMSEISDQGSLIVQAKDAIAQALSEGTPRMSDIARSLRMSVRSFHRRLSEHGMGFQTLTEETRRELAEGLLREERYSLAEIAFLTGFSEQSAFTRAFKRWVGRNSCQLPQGSLRLLTGKAGLLATSVKTLATPVNTTPTSSAYSLAVISSRGARSMLTKPILIVGATGKTGSRVAAKLDMLGYLVRRGSRYSATPFDWDAPETWAAALDGVRSAYVTYFPDLAFPGAVEKLEAFCETARAVGVAHLVLLSGRGEDHARLGEEVVRNAGMDFTIVRAAWFAQNFSEGSLRNPILAGVLPMPGGAIREPIIDIDDIADVAVAALTEDRHKGELYEVTGPRLLTFADMANELGQAIGSPIRHIPISFEDFRASIARSGGEFVADVFTVIARETLDGRNAHVTDGVQRALGRPPRDFADFAKDAARSGAWAAAA